MGESWTFSVQGTHVLLHGQDPEALPTCFWGVRVSLGFLIKKHTEWQLATFTEFCFFCNTDIFKPHQFPLFLVVTVLLRCKLHC